MAFLVCAVILFVLGVLIGQRAGSELGAKAVTKRDYWLANAGVALGGAIAVAVFGLLTLVLLEALAFGFIAGGIVGLKLAFGESVGFWKAHDRFYNVNRRHREAAEKGTGEKRRRARRRGEEPPAVISVTPDGPATNPPQAADEEGGQRTGDAPASGKRS